jgi:hypothetical protein
MCMVRVFAGLLTTVLMSFTVIIPAGAVVRPDSGGQTYNAPMCGNNAFVRVKLPTSEFTIHDSAGTCINAMRRRLDFAVTSIPDQISWQYPNIASGYELGESSCASEDDTCFGYPVQERFDGHPEASVKAWLARGTYNFSFDTWFAPRKTQLSYQDRRGDTEVMVWLAAPGINDASHFVWYTRIDGIAFGVMTWETGGDQPHRYVAYVARYSHLGSYNRSRVWLNPFFQDTINHGYLSPNAWLTSIDLGFELVRGGVGDNIHYYALQNVR